METIHYFVYSLSVCLLYTVRSYTGVTPYSEHHGISTVSLQGAGPGSNRLLGSLDGKRRLQLPLYSANLSCSRECDIYRIRSEDRSLTYQI
jgi:hypothetical protein